MYIKDCIYSEQLATRDSRETVSNSERQLATARDSELLRETVTVATARDSEQLRETVTVATARDSEQLPETVSNSERQ